MKKVKNNENQQPKNSTDVAKENLSRLKNSIQNFIGQLTITREKNLVILQNLSADSDHEYVVEFRDFLNEAVRKAEFEIETSNRKVEIIDELLGLIDIDPTAMKVYEALMELNR